MPAHAIHTDAAPKAVGPYSQGYVAGDFLFLSGQGGLNPATGALAGADVASQAEQTMQNIGALLQAAGVGFDAVVKTTCFLTDMADFKTFNGIYERYFTSKPARSCVAVRELPVGMQCEVEVIAYLK